MYFFVTKAISQGGRVSHPGVQHQQLNLPCNAKESRWRSVKVTYENESVVQRGDIPTMKRWSTPSRKLRQLLAVKGKLHIQTLRAGFWKQNEM